MFAIDFTGIDCCESDEHDEPVSAPSHDTELENLRALMRELLRPDFVSADASSPPAISGQLDHDLLQQLVGDGQPSDESEPPPLSQWQQMFTRSTPTLQTDLIEAFEVPADGGVTDGGLTREMSPEDADRVATPGWEQTPVNTSRKTERTH